MSEVKQKIFRSVGSSSLGRFVQAILALLINSIIVKNYSVSEVANYFYILNVVSILSIVVVFGFNTQIIKSISKERYSHADYSVNETTLYFFITMLMTSLFVCLFVLSDFFYEMSYKFELTVDRSMWFVVLGWVVVISLQVFFADMCRGNHQISRSVLLANQGAVGSLGYGLLSSIFLLLAFFVFSLADLEVPLEGLFALGVGVGLLGIVILFRGKLSVSVFREVSFFRYVGCLKLVFPFFILSLFSIVVNQVDVWVVTFFLGEKELAVYSVALKLSIFFMFSLIVMTTFFQPIIADEYHKGDVPQLELIMKIGLTSVLFVAVTVFLFFCFFGKEVILLLFGENYIASYDVLLVRGLGVIFFLISGVASLLLSMTGKAISMVFLNFTYLFVFYILYWLLADESMKDVSYVYLYSNVILSILSVYVVKMKVDIWLIPSFKFTTKYYFKLLSK